MFQSFECRFWLLEFMHFHHSPVIIQPFANIIIIKQGKNILCENSISFYKYFFFILCKVISPKNKHWNYELLNLFFILKHFHFNLTFDKLVNCWKLQFLNKIVKQTTNLQILYRKQILFNKTSLWNQKLLLWSDFNKVKTFWCFQSFQIKWK